VHDIKTFTVDNCQIISQLPDHYKPAGCGPTLEKRRHKRKHEKTLSDAKLEESADAGNEKKLKRAKKEEDKEGGKKKKKKKERKKKNSEEGGADGGLLPANQTQQVLSIGNTFGAAATNATASLPIISSSHDFLNF